MSLPRAHSIALLSLLVVLTAPAFAQTRYDVEIVVFQQSPAGGGEERWRPGIVVPEFARAGSFDATAAGSTATTDSTEAATEPGTTEAGVGMTRAALKPLPEGFERLPADSARLRQAVQRLESSGRYRVLRHLHWRQPSLAPGESVPVRVSAGEPIEIRVPSAELEHVVPAAGNTEATRAEEEEPADAANGDRAKRDDDEDDRQASSAGARMDPSNSLGIAGPFGLELRPPRIRRVSVHPLDGTVELVVSRYLHVHADLYYTTDVEWERTVVAEGVGPEAAAQAGDEQDDTTTAAAAAAAPRIARGPDDRPMLSFPFEQQRRMRSGELHYLDHPLLGLLVLVTPYKADDEQVDAADEGA